MRFWAVGVTLLSATELVAQDINGRQVYLESNSGDRIEIATLVADEEGAYAVAMKDDAFSDHFLSMRPFKCVDGPDKTWCHVPYPYEIKREISNDLTDLEYDFLFVWKGRADYGIDMWNGVYYVLSAQGDTLVGSLHEMNMDVLAVPPDAGNLRPIRDVHLEESDPESHWLPRLVIE